MGNSHSGGTTDLAVGGDGFGVYGAFEARFGEPIDGGAEPGPAEYLASAARRRTDAAAAKTFEAAARRVARAMKALNVDIDPEGDVLEAMRVAAAAIPSPSNGKKFREDAESKRKLCSMVARALNDQFTPGATTAAEMLIDPEADPEYVCDRVGRIVRSFAAGAHSAFLAIQKDAKRDLEEMTIALKFLEESHARAVAAAADPEDGAAAEAEAQFKLAAAELGKFVTQLDAALLGAVPDAESSLAARLAEDEWHKTDGLGTEAAKRYGVGRALTDLTAAAAAAAKAAKALKALGADRKEFLSDPRGVLKALDREAMKGAPSVEKLAAIDALRKLIRTERGVEALGEYTGGYHGGAPKTKMELRVEKAKNERELIVADYKRRMRGAYAGILRAVAKLAPALGESVPITEHTEILRRAFKELEDAESEARGFEWSLVGLHMDAPARAKKDAFVRALRGVMSACDHLVGIAAYARSSALFAGIREAAAEALATVEFFGDLVARKYGGSDAVSGGAEPTDLSLQEVSTQFASAYFAAKVRANLAYSAEEIASFGEGYADMLGAAVAERLDLLERSFADRKAVIDRMSAAIPAAAPAAAKKALSDASTLLEKQRKAKIDFYSAVQALDLYMKEFAAAIAGDPAAVLSVKADIEGVITNARWFSDDSGDSLVDAFEMMRPVGNMAGGVYPAAAAPRDLARTAPHYYAEAAIGVDAGHPLGSVDGTRALKVSEKVDRAVDAFSGLKNLVNAFSRIGDKFGGATVRSKVFLNPTQIYRALVNYIKASALVVNADPVEAVPVPVGPYTSGIDPAAVIGAGEFIFASVPHDSLPVAPAAGPGAPPPPYVPPLAALLGLPPAAIGAPAPAPGMAPLVPAPMPGAPAPGMVPLIPAPAPPAPAPMPGAPAPGMVPLIPAPAPPAPAAGVVPPAPPLPPPAAPRAPVVIRRAAPAAPAAAAPITHQQELQRGMARRIARTNDYTDDQGHPENMFHGYNTYQGYRAQGMSDAEASRRIATYGAAELPPGTAVPMNAFAGDFEDEDRLFAIVVKAMCAKILTVAATCDLFERRTPGERALPIRMILGGGPEFPDAIDGAAELYFRLPRLVEFYRGALGISSAPLYAAHAISLIPEVEGVFSGLIRLVFLRHGGRAVGVLGQPGQYSDSELARIVGEINAIYAHFKTKEDPVGAAVHALIGEINRRYGVISERDRQMFYTDLAQYERVQKGTAAPATKTDYEILPGEGDEHELDIAGRAPSDRYRVPGAVGSQSSAFADLRASGLVLDKMQAGSRREMLRAFRANIETMLGGLSTMPTANFQPIGRLIRNGVDRMRAANGAEKTKCAFDLIQSSGLTDYDTASAIGFHENVVTPLAVLGAIESTVRRFAEFVEVAETGIAANILAHLLDDIFVLASGGLVEYQFSTQGGTPNIRVNFSKLQNKAEALVGQVRAQLDRYRATVPATIVAQYAGDPSAPAVGSLAWIETNLVDRFFSGGVEGQATRDAAVNTSLDGLAARVAAVFAVQASTAANVAAAYDMLVYCPVAGPLAGASAFEMAATTPFPGNNGVAPAAGAPAGALALFDGATTRVTANRRSIALSFNDLLARYIGTLTYNKKSYASAIAPVISGVLSGAAAAPALQADDTAYTAAAARGHPLLRSLAYALQRFGDVNDRTQQPAHLLATLTDVPSFQKEKMRCYLPYFAQLFEALVSKAEFIRESYELTSLAVVPQVGADLAAIVSAAGAVVSACRSVLRELGENSYAYGSTGEGSIEAYTARTGKSVLAPLSLSLVPFAATAADTPVTTPSSNLSVGSDEFKTAYALRPALAGATPVSGFTGADSDVAAQTLELVRYLHQVRRVRGELAIGAGMVPHFSTSLLVPIALPARAAARPLLPLAGPQAWSGAGAIPYPARPRAIGDRTRLIVDILENANQTKHVTGIAAACGVMAVANDRSREIALNIVDLNVVPINVHALMRGIPLANLYNYESTFEQLACGIYGMDSARLANDPRVAGIGNPQNTRDMLLKLLVDPYAPLNDREYGSDVFDHGPAGFVHRLFRGDASVGGGRPKFLSDQLFGKSLFGSIVGTAAYDEAGPAASASATRAAGAADGAITYLTVSDGTNPGTSIVSVAVGAAAKARLAAVGKARFDTRLVRKLVLITLANRLIRLKLKRELTGSRAVLLPGVQAVQDGVTEFGFDPFNPHEVLASNSENYDDRRNAAGNLLGHTRFVDGRV